MYEIIIFLLVIIAGLLIDICLSLRTLKSISEDKNFDMAWAEYIEAPIKPTPKKKTTKRKPAKKKTAKKKSTKKK